MVEYVVSCCCCWFFFSAVTKQLRKTPLREGKFILVPSLRVQSISVKKTL